MAKKPRPASPAAGQPATSPAGEPKPKACSILPDTVLGDDVALVAENMERILSAPSYSLAMEDPALLQKVEMRGVRMLLELGKPELALQADNIVSTVIVFGGAPHDKRLTRELDRSRRLLDFSHFYDEAREFARIVSIDNQCDDKRDYVVVTGGGPGIMEAANRGAFDVGCKSIGLNIKLPAEQQPNPFITPELCFQFKYFALRKFHFILRAAAVVLFPGGFGTLDEMFETLTLRQTHRMQPVPIILYGRDYWSKVVDFQHLADCGVISDAHLDLFTYAETPLEAWEQILAFHARPHPA